MAYLFASKNAFANPSGVMLRMIVSKGILVAFWYPSGTWCAFSFLKDVVRRTKFPAIGLTGFCVGMLKVPHRQVRFV